MRTIKFNTCPILTIENANSVKTVMNIKNPEWGIKAFNYNAQPLPDNKFCSTVGKGCNEAVLFESDYNDWCIITYK